MLYKKISRLVLHLLCIFEIYCFLLFKHFILLYIFNYEGNCLFQFYGRLAVSFCPLSLILCSTSMNVHKFKAIWWFNVPIIHTFCYDIVHDKIDLICSVVKCLSRVIKYYSWSYIIFNTSTSSI